VGAIIPWNAPIVNAAGKVAPALACGNSVILKPAEQAPLSSLELATIARDAGLPAGVLNVIPGTGEGAGAALVQHPDVDKIAFTGGTATGQVILKQAADTIKSVTLELGGKAPHIVFADADLDAAMMSALFSPFNHAGQICTAGTRLFVNCAFAEDFVAELVRRASALRLGDPSQPTTQIGPLISGEQQERVTGMVREAISEGARLRTGGGPPPGDDLARGYYFEPTVFDEVDPASNLAQHEVFGPVVSVFEFNDLDDLIVQANQVRYGLSASVWTSNIHTATELALRLDAGTVWINSVHKLDPSVPFSGFKASGLGSEYGTEAIDTYTRLKTVWTATRPQRLDWD
ncbi:MAG: aldehyde dehydrogenase family protein, partial [Acidimicrobiia bacterium]